MEIASEIPSDLLECSLCFMLEPCCKISGETARILSECTAVTKSGTGTWDWDSETWDSGTRDSVTRGTWDSGDVGLGGRGTRGRRTQERGTRGRVGTRGRDQQTTPEFVKYNSRWSRLKV